MKFKVLDLDKPNWNNRIYSTKLVKEKIINSPLVQEQLKNHCLFVELNNSNYDSSTIDLKYVIGIIENLYIEDDALYAEANSLTDYKLNEIYICGLGDLYPINESLQVNEDNYTFTKFVGNGERLTWKELNKKGVI